MSGHLNFDPSVETAKGDGMVHTDKKEKKIFLEYKKIQNGGSCKVIYD